MARNSASLQVGADPTSREELESVVVRFAGDSGDGIQLTGGQFALGTALAGNDLATFPDFPAEIRAPVGTTYGVSAYQINFGGRKIYTSGDQPDALVALNPAALKVNASELRPGGLIIVDAVSFSDRNLRKAGYQDNPLEDGSLDSFKVVSIDITRLTQEAVSDVDVTKKEADRCKNLWALGLVYWLYGRDREATTEWVRAKFAKKPHLADANIAALNAGHAYGETAELSGDLSGFTVPPVSRDQGLYRMVTGNETMAWGLVAGCELIGLDMFFGSYPITPASPVLHQLAKLKQFGVVTFQAEDEIAAICAAIGASYGGKLGVTSSSGPGIALKTEAIGLAIGVELPLVIVNVQRAGPSTGLPTKTEQSDLFQAVYGRNADAPIAVIAARSPGDCFDVAIEACRIATKYMTPVMVLSDGYISNASEPWLVPDMTEYKQDQVSFRDDPEGFHPFVRDPETLARAWAIPGTPGLEHRIGGIEKDYNSGHISYDPDNHQKMTNVRAEKIRGISRDIPAQGFEQGSIDDDLLIIGWGSTYGPIARAVSRMRAEGRRVAQAHLRHIWPHPTNLRDILAAFNTVLVPEMNNGQLATLLRGEYLLPIESLTKVTGRPFKITEIEEAIKAHLET